jgi:gliding motility-associated-like protein
MILKRFIFSILLILGLFSNHLYCQYVSQDNHTGYWNDSTSWNTYPGTSVKKITIDCYGYLTSLNCLDMNLGSITIHDTLVLNGNLDLQNKETLVVDSSAILIIFGDLGINNQTIVQNYGTLIISGNFTILGSANVGSFENPSKQLYILDSTPEFPEGGGYQDLACPDPFLYPDSCGYGNFNNLKRSKIFDFYNSLPYSKREFSSSDNSCFSYDVISSKKHLCTDEPTSYQLVSVGINPADSVVWNFGSDATPQTASGFGPHQVSYNNHGTKSFTIQVISDTVFSIEKQDLTTVESIINSGDIFLNSNPQSMYEQVIDDACEGDQREYSVDTNSKAIFNWLIPALNIDTLCNNSIQVRWPDVPGDYEVYLQAISYTGCLGTLSEAHVQVNECSEENKLDEKYYAFSPNGDGINDTWVIDRIENYPDAQIFIYDKTGKLLYKSSHNYMNDWNGTYNNRPLPLDSYFFIIDLTKYNKGIKKGIVTIVPLSSH